MVKKVDNMVKKVDNMVKKDEVDSMVKKEIVPRPPKGPPPAHLMMGQTTKMGPRPPLYPPPEHLLIEQLQWWKGPPPAQTTKMGPRPPLVPPPEHLLIEQLQWWASAPYEPKPEEPSEKDPVDQSFSIQMKPHISVAWDRYMPTDTIGHMGG